jgi:hypothetical protein
MRAAALLHALSYAVLVGLIAQTRVELGAVRAQQVHAADDPTLSLTLDAGSRRSLSSSDRPLGPGGAGEHKGDRIDADVARLKEAMTAMRGEVGSLSSGAAALSRRVARLEEGDENSRRRAQGAEPEPEPDIGDVVKIIKPAVVRCGGPGGTTNDGQFDYSQCADRAFARCHATACAGHTGHRRVQSANGACSATDLSARTAEITDECCNEPTEDCSGGSPHTCNPGCAAIFLPFWSECRSVLGKATSQFEPAAALCEQAVASSPPASLAEQLNVHCTDGTDAADCVPACTEELHGYLMLLNLEGDDSKLSCELHHGLYSWVGSAIDGGYLGEDWEAFFSAVNSAAPGLYALSLHADTGGATLVLSVQPGQLVTVSGLASAVVPPTWGGTGGFRVHNRGALLLEHVTIVASVNVDSGGSLTIQDVSGAGAAVIISAGPNVEIIAADLRFNGVRFQCPVGGTTACSVELDGAVHLSGPRGITINSHGEVTAAQEQLQYSGSDGYALSTMVQTGAAGLYQGLGLTRSPGVSATMTVRAAQVVQIVADQSTVLAWGAGAFTVQETGSLALSWMDVPGDVRVDAGGSFSVTECIIRGEVVAQGTVQAISTLFMEGSSFQVSSAANVVVNGGTFDRSLLTVDGQLHLAEVDVTCGSTLEVATGGSVTIDNSSLLTPITVDEGGNLQLAMVTSADFPYTDSPVIFGVGPSGNFDAGGSSAFDPQCFQPFELLTEAWRKSADDGGTRATDSTLGGRWFRIAGDAGTRLRTTPPGFYRCGTTVGGWLSGCPMEGATPSCNSQGHFPQVQDGVVEKVVCFDVGSGTPCRERVVARVVNCGAFTLAQLPNAPPGPRAYCTE